MNVFKRIAPFLIISTIAFNSFADVSVSNFDLPVDKSFELKVNLHSGKNKITIEASDFVICSYFDEAGVIRRVDTKRQICVVSTEIISSASMKIVVKNISNNDVTLKVSKE